MKMFRCSILNIFTIGLEKIDSLPSFRYGFELVHTTVAMKCPICSMQGTVRDTRDIPYTYKGETTVISSVAGDFCSACGEAVFAAEEAQRVSEAMLAFNKQVNASIVDPKFIASVRKKLRLDQKEAADIFGGGVNAFSRYETGKTKPPVSLVKLLKILNSHPELLEFVK